MVLEKVYVALGNDLQEGFKTLDWTLRKWKSNPISIVILHESCNFSDDFVYTPFGKLPAHAVSEEKLGVLRKYEKEKINKLLSKYIGHCGKVKAETERVVKSDVPIHKVLVELITSLRINKLVLGLSFMKSASQRSRAAINGSLYIEQHKPEFCEFFLIDGGNLVKRSNIKSWFGRIFSENSINSPRRPNNSSSLSRNLDSCNSPSNWENHVHDLENYFEFLSSQNLDEEVIEEDDTNSVEQNMVRNVDSNENSAAKLELARAKIDEQQKIILSKKEETKANEDRCTKAEWAISLCAARIDELEAKIKEEGKIRIQIEKELEAKNELNQEIKIDVEQSKSRLCSLLEVQTELSNKLQTAVRPRACVEAQLEKAIVERAKMVREMEELRRQRDVLQLRIEFCKEKDGIGRVAKSGVPTSGYRDYTAEDVGTATDDFSERLRLTSGGDWTEVYRGRISNKTVAIKKLDSNSGMSQEVFVSKMKLLNSIRHPHLMTVMGFCTELKCIIFEYMHNGSLTDVLFFSERNRRKRNRILGWHDRVRIIHEVCTVLSFLHLARPRPIIHGHLTASNILLDRNLVAKVSGFGLTQSNEINPQVDIRAFGVILFHLLTGRNWAGLVEEGMAMDRMAIARVLDESAGQWPLDLAEKLIRIATRCTLVSQGLNSDLNIPGIKVELDEVRRIADDIAARGGNCEVVNDEGFGNDPEDSHDIPRIFICPIFQEIMKNPHVAADGFSYELEAIQEWFKTGDTSPMTNLTLMHKFLTPNHTLRVLIEDWRNRACANPP